MDDKIIYDILHEVNGDVDFEALTDFMETEALDSIDIMTLVELLEDRFSIEIGGKDIIPENFRNVDAICGLVKKYGGSL